MYAYFTTYYSLTTQGGADYVKIDSVKGGFSSNSGGGSNVGSGCYVTSQYIDVGQTGMTYGLGVKTQRAMGVSFSVNSRSWTYTAPSWTPIKTTGAGGTVGVNMYLTIKRGSSSWTTHIQDMLVSNGIPNGIGR